METSTLKMLPKQLNKSFQNYDNISRMNYLFELGKLTNKKYPQLSSFYSKHLKLISRKTQQRLDASIKHYLCKACNGHLQSNPAVKIKLKKKHIFQTCPNCGNVKRFPCDTRQDKDYNLDSGIHEIYFGHKKDKKIQTDSSQSKINQRKNSGCQQHQQKEKDTPSQCNKTLEDGKIETIWKISRTVHMNILAARKLKYLVCLTRCVRAYVDRYLLFFLS